MHIRGERASRRRDVILSVRSMNPLARLRVQRLTRAVFREASGDARGERPRRLLRLLPSASSLIALLLVLALLAAAGATRVGASDLVPAEGPASGRNSAQSIPSPHTSEDTRPALVVHVAGAVAEPGVVELDAGARVVDAIERAGGAAADADLDALNLARLLVDGEQVRVPRIGESAMAEGVSADSALPAPLGCVDLNTADAPALESLDGIGPALAERILAFRESSGPFESVDDLDAVPGIGPSLVEKARHGACR